MRIRFRPTARNEFLEAVQWYEDKKTGVGERFTTDVHAKLDSIRRQPDLYPVVFGEVREATLLRFPHAIYFIVDPDEIVVVAVFHTSRDPSVWQSRVEES